jgi:carbon monoxide dehydrogenase subunit G
MNMTGSQRIEASRETVKRCIPGCESIEKLSDTSVTASLPNTRPRAFLDH